MLGVDVGLFCGDGAELLGAAEGVAGAAHGVTGGVLGGAGVALGGGQGVDGAPRRGAGAAEVVDEHVERGLSAECAVMRCVGLLRDLGGRVGIAGRGVKRRDVRRLDVAQRDLGENDGLPGLEDSGACAKGNGFKVGDGEGTVRRVEARFGEGEDALTLQDGTPLLGVVRAVDSRAPCGKQG